jgi:hypothetical protein
MGGKAGGREEKREGGKGLGKNVRANHASFSPTSLSFSISNPQFQLTLPPFLPSSFSCGYGTYISHALTLFVDIPNWTDYELVYPLRVHSSPMLITPVFIVEGGEGGREGWHL